MDRLRHLRKNVGWLGTLQVAAALLACSAQTPPAADIADPPPPVTAPTTADPDAGFTDVGGGLAVRLVLPPGPHNHGSTIELTLEFRNISQDDLRIYLVDPPIFRALQSDLAILAPDGKLLDRQPEPHPHGYVVSERDFPPLAPGVTRRFTQPLFLDPKLADASPGDLQVRWTYRNKIESWAGGTETLDGPTKTLFGGGRIPGIWLGELTLTVPLPISR